jgi:hypothetical protein
MADITSFNDWLEKFQKSNRGRHALEDLDKFFPPDKESEQVRLFHPLRAAVLASCYGATMFDPQNDPDKKKPRLATNRITTAKAAREIGSQRNAIANLREFITKYRSLATIALGGALADLRESKSIRFSATEDKKTVHDVVDILDFILESFSSRLVRSIPFISNEAQLSRFVYGCLIYDSPLDTCNAKNLPGVNTMLLFDLVQTFRLRSQKIPQRQTGEHMPVKGKPHNALAAAFLSATFNEKPIISGEAARCLLRALTSSVGYFPWPAHRF